MLVFIALPFAFVLSLLFADLSSDNASEHLNAISTSVVIRWNKTHTDSQINSISCFKWTKELEKERKINNDEQLLSYKINIYAFACFALTRGSIFFRVFVTIILSEVNICSDFNLLENTNPKMGEANTNAHQFTKEWAGIFFRLRKKVCCVREWACTLFRSSAFHLFIQAFFIFRKCNTHSYGTNCIHFTSNKCTSRFSTTFFSFISLLIFFAAVHSFSILSIYFFKKKLEVKKQSWKRTPRFKLNERSEKEELFEEEKKMNDE